MNRIADMSDATGSMQSVSQCVRRAVQTRPNGLATSFEGRRRTWTEFQARVARLAGGLGGLGLSRGGRVAILALNSDRYLELLFAVPWSGGAVVPINTRLAPPEIDYILADSGTEILAVDGAFAAMLPRIPSVVGLKAVVAFDAAAMAAGRSAFEALIDAAAPAPDAGREGRDLAGIFYTGGTTGRAKGVMLSHDNLIANALNAIAGFSIDEDTVYLHSGPMFHLADGASSFAVTMCGGVHAFVARFDPLPVLQAIQAERVTFGIMVPTMLNMLVNHPDVTKYDLSSWRRCGYGASPMPEAILLRAMELMPKILFQHAYGMTELSPIATLLPPRYNTVSGPHAGRLKSCGVAAMTAEVRIVDPEDNEVPRGTVGEVCVRGPMVMLGYWNKPQETAAALRGGWMHTGDAGTMDAEGFVYIVDRVKDMIISGGENVYSAEVESAISLLAGVQECAVIAVPDERWGERVHAIIVPKAGVALTPDGVVQHCRKHIAGYKCPRSVEIRKEALPISGAGKILKSELRKPFWAGREKQVN
jgi:long-chain acyl-CoA synthetase